VELHVFDRHRPEPSRWHLRTSRGRLGDHRVPPSRIVEPPDVVEGTDFCCVVSGGYFVICRPTSGDQTKPSMAGPHHTSPADAMVQIMPLSPICLSRTLAECSPAASSRCAPEGGWRTEPAGRVTEDAGLALAINPAAHPASTHSSTSPHADRSADQHCRANARAPRVRNRVNVSAAQEIAILASVGHHCFGDVGSGALVQPTDVRRRQAVPLRCFSRAFMLHATSWIASAR